MRRAEIAHRNLLQLYGERSETCGECRFLRGLHYSHTYYKCEKGPLTHGSATDWRVKWQACGKFEPRPADTDAPTPARAATK